MEIEAVGFGNVVSQPLRQSGADAVGQREREIDGVAQRLTDEKLEILLSPARPIAQEARQGSWRLSRGPLSEMDSAGQTQSGGPLDRLRALSSSM